MEQEYRLTKDEQALVSATLRPIQALQAELSAILSGILRHRELTGVGWVLQGDKLVRSGAPQIREEKEK